MINKHYRQAALDTYNEECEICGRKTSLEVHHIDYKEQWEMEKKVREAEKNIGSKGFFSNLLEQAKKLGYIEYKNNQLSKNDSTKNLAVLCGNCHSLIHLLDSGKNLLKAIKQRR